MPLDSSSVISLLQQLQQSELSLKQSQEIAGMGSWEWNADTNLAKWSENTYALYEIKREDIEPTFEYFLSRLHPDDVAQIAAVHERMQRDRNPVDMEVRVLFPGNKMKWFLNRMIPAFNGDRLIGIKGINLDITERKTAEESFLRLNAELERKVIARTEEMHQREEQYHLLLETMKEGVLFVDNDDKIIFANAHFCTMVGYALEEIIGKRGTDLFLDEEDRQKMLDVQHERINSRKGSYEIRMKTKSGNKIWVQINGTPVMNNDGQIIGSLGTHSDISPLKQHVHDLEGILFALSHQVRQPIANIIGMARLLEQEGLSETELRKIVSYMRDSASTLDIFTRQLTLLLSENKHLTARKNGITL